MAEASKNLVTKKQLENALDFGDKNRKRKKKLQTFIICFSGKSYFDDDGLQTLMIFNQFLSIFKFLLALLINFFGCKSKGCQKKVSLVLLHQTIVAEDKVSYTHKRIKLFYCDLDIWSCDLNPNFTLKDYLFGAVKCYLYCKMITSQNMPSEAQVKNFLFS